MITSLLPTLFMALWWLHLDKEESKMRLNLMEDVSILLCSGALIARSIFCHTILQMFKRFTISIKRRMEAVHVAQRVTCLGFLLYNYKMKRIVVFLLVLTSLRSHISKTNHLKQMYSTFPCLLMFGCYELTAN